MMAKGIFGENYTDVIIPVDSARKILYSNQNIELLKDGKIIIICNLPVKKEMN